MDEMVGAELAGMQWNQLHQEAERDHPQHLHTDPMLCPTCYEEQKHQEGDFIRDDTGRIILDMRTVYLAPAGQGQWYNRDPGRYHTSQSCAARGQQYRSDPDARGPNLDLVREVFLEAAVKEGYTACGICAKNVSLPPGAY